MPASDVCETGDHITVRADVPGIDAVDREVGVSGSLLTIRGERKVDKKEENASFHWLKRRNGSSRRSFTLPADV